MNRNRTLWLAGALALTAGTSLAQTARLQVIHNSADAAAAVVDVYVNGSILINDFAFRTAWGYNDVPSGVNLQVGIAPGNSSSAADTIPGLGATYNLPAGGTFVLVANGIVIPAGYNPVQPFELYAAAGQETSGAGTTAVNVFHGSTDAPAVDVFESAVLGVTAISNLAYGNFTGYLTLPTDDYVLEIRPAGNPNTLVAYSAPLATLGLGGVALNVVASGFLDPSVNNNGPGFGLWVALPSGGALIPLPVYTPPTARLQVIHNSADAAAASVDVYVNGGLLIDNFTFRTAWGFNDVPAGVDLQVGIAPGNSTSAADTIPGLGATYNLADGVAYVLVANGIVVPAGYNPVQPFELYPFGPAREAATSGAANTDILVFHGSTDAPTVDVGETAVLGGATIVDDMAYGEFAGYLEVPTADYVLEVRLSDGTPVVSYQAPLSTLNLQGAALTVVASGFLDPSANNNGPAFGLWVALPSGGALVELPVYTPPTARLQVIHNSADAAAASVDVYVNGGLLIDNFTFRTAWGFNDVPAGVDLQVGIAPGNSTSAADTIPGLGATYNLADGVAYVLVANGIVVPAGYNPVQPFELYPFGPAREAATSGASNTDILVFHGATDAPTVDVGETAVLGGATIVDDLAYGEFAGYLEVPTDDYVLQVRLSDGTPVVSYQAPLSTLGLQGAALTVVASGFLDPSVNNNGPAFGLWVALPSGGDLVELPLATAVQSNDLVSGLNVWPNPANDQLFVSVNSTRTIQAQIRLTDLTGRVVRTVATNGLAAGENRLAIDLNGLAEGMYQLSIAGEGAVRTVPVQVVR